VAEIEIIGAIEQTLFVSDIKLKNKISLVTELQNRNVARICPDTKTAILEYLNFLSGRQIEPKDVEVKVESVSPVLTDRNAGETGDDDFELNLSAISKKSDEIDSTSVSEFELVTARVSRFLFFQQCNLNQRKI